MAATSFASSMHRLPLALLASFALAACAPGGGDASDDAADLEDDAESSSRAILGGTPATEHPEAVLIDMAQGGQTSSICTGALIAPRLVLTAGHCVHGYDGFAVTAPATGAKRHAEAVAVYDWNTGGRNVNPNQHDVALLWLDASIELESYPTVTSKRLPWGAEVRNVGRIDDGEVSFSQLYIGAPVQVFDGAQMGFPLSYMTSELIESGDSGGPVYQAGTRHIVAVNSGSGGGTQVLARVDLVAEWIVQQGAAWDAEAAASAQQPAPVQDPCGGITFQGGCRDASTVEWCEGGEVRTMSCTDGALCGYRSEHGGYYDCVP